MKIEQIARICHEAIRLYCEDTNHPTLLPWSHAPEWQRTSAIAGVQNVLDNPYVTPAENHEAWSAHKRAEGWTFAPVKDADAKTHPCLVPFHQLPIGQQVKDILFVNIVRALMPPPMKEEIKYALSSQQLYGEQSHDTNQTKFNFGTSASPMSYDELMRQQATQAAGSNFDPSKPILVPNPIEAKEASIEENLVTMAKKEEKSDGEETNGENPAAQAAGDGQEAAGGEGQRPAEEGRVTSGSST